jgi:hypothetical protein
MLALFTFVSEKTHHVAMTLSGMEYLDCNFWPGAPIVGNTDTVELSFQTNEHSAAIFYAGKYRCEQRILNLVWKLYVI